MPTRHFPRALVDKTRASGLNGTTMRRPALALVPLLALSASAAAMVGGAREIPDAKAQPEVMFVGSRGNFCTGTAIARDLVLTAAHCVLPGADCKLVELGADKTKPILT